MKYECDHNYFEKIDTEEKAYWLGFLYADGYVRLLKRNSGQIKLKLNTKDKDHIILFKECIKSTNPVINKIDKFTKNGKEYTSFNSTISIYSKKMVDDLISHGCFNNKTFKIRIPDLQSLMLNHFIRGYFDGDGCIYKVKSRPNSYSISICSNHNFAIDMLNFINIGYILKKDNYSLLLINKISEIKKFRELIYNNSNIFLQRKYLKFYSIVDDYKRGFTKTKKRYQVIDPNGKEFIIESLSKFCKEQNLIYSTMSNLSRGIGKNNKGWICKIKNNK